MGQFQNKLLTPYNRNFGNLEEMIIQLYQKGITTREIADITDLFTFLEFPESIRPSIYSNNLIEGWNKHLKRRISHKE